jgi:hypothetical protein
MIMALIVLTSACGAPGVTTITLGLACTWSRQAIAVEADPVGGSSILAGFFQGLRPPRHSVVDLLLAHRGDHLAEEFPDSLIPIDSTTASVLSGPRSHAQARSVLDLWEPLALLWKSLERSNTDVFIDAGRLGMASYPEPLLRLSDLNLLVTRSNLPALTAANQWAERALHTRTNDPATATWGVILVDPGHPYSAREVTTVLGLPVVSTLCLDPRGALVYSAGKTVRGSTKLSKDLRGCGFKVRSMLTGDTLITNRRPS